MSDHQKTYSGVKVTQEPGGKSSCPLNWGYQEEPVKKKLDKALDTGIFQQSKNPEKEEK